MSKFKKILGGIFGGAPKMPALPKPIDQSQVKVPEHVKKRAARRSGVASTILTQQKNDDLGGGKKPLGGA